MSTWRSDGDQLGEDQRGDIEPESIVFSNVSEERPISEDELKRLRDEYGYIRSYFKTHPKKHAKVQRWLNQARMGQTYDEYLARAVKVSIGVGVLGILLGGLLTFVLSQLGIIATLSNPTPISGSFVGIISSYRTVLLGFFLSIIGGALLGGGTWGMMYYVPYMKVSTRRQSINMTLPHGIIFLYALSYGGMNLLEAMNRLTEAEETYGEIANEFEMVVNDVELFGSDMYTALQNARNLTPSDNLEQFLDDMIGILDAGGDLTVFLEEESERYLDKATEEQEAFLETLSLLAEVFVVTFVAAPLFLIVVLVVIGMLGGQTLLPVLILIYLVIPIATGGMIFLTDLLSQPFKQPEAIPAFEYKDEDIEPDEDDERLKAYNKLKRRLKLKSFKANPLSILKGKPLRTLYFTVPFTLIYLVIGVLVGFISLSIDTMLANPVGQTTALFVIPFLAISAPLSFFHEVERRRRIEISTRFPDAMNILASTNRMGIPITDALELVSKWSTGKVAVELRKVRNDINWNHDVRRALIRMGNRIKVPQLTRTMTLLAEGIRSSGDVARVLSIAAEDSRNRANIERMRRRSLTSYIVVVIVGFLVFLLVIHLLSTGFLVPFESVSGGNITEGAANESAVPQAPTAPTTYTSLPTRTFQLIFFHSTLIQALGSGLIAGKLANNDTLSGLKFSIGLIVVSLAAFALL